MPAAMLCLAYGVGPGISHFNQFVEVVCLPVLLDEF